MSKVIESNTILEKLIQLKEEVGSRKFGDFMCWDEKYLSEVLGVPVTHVEECRDEGGGGYYDGYHAIVSIEGRYYRVDGAYQSEEGVIWEYGDKPYEVKPVEKTIITWEAV